MASITVRKLDDDLKKKLRVRATENGDPWSAEVRCILAEAVGRRIEPKRRLGTAIHEPFKPFGGVELDLTPREPVDELPEFA